MDSKVEIRKIERTPRGGIPSIVVTALVMAVALAAIVLVQKYANDPHSAGASTGASPSVETRQPNS